MESFRFRSVDAHESQDSAYSLEAVNDLPCTVKISRYEDCWHRKSQQEGLYQSTLCLIVPPKLALKLGCNAYFFLAGHPHELTERQIKVVRVDRTSMLVKFLAKLLDAIHHHISSVISGKARLSVAEGPPAGCMNPRYQASARRDGPS